MSKIVWITLFIFSNLFAMEWKYQYQFVLKKDQIAKVKISYRDKKVYLRDGEFDFRWTLYKNGALVTFSSYQKIKDQHVLYDKYGLDSFEVELVPRGANLLDRVYLLVVFRSFNSKKKRATIDIFIKDDNVKILADFIDPNSKEINIAK